MTSSSTATKEPKEDITFDHFRLSRETKEALKKHDFIKPTSIQRKSIPLALKGKDVLAAAKTGSGKTLAFLIPVLERLKKEKFVPQHGLGALILTPTRELAYQIFEVLKKLGSNHEFSAALVIGGKDLKYESSRLGEINILICTPGRLLHHMDNNYLLDCNSLQILVIDEADKILEMGFRQTVDSIIDNLPPNRQTLLFSATQTTKVEDLSRLALKDASYVFAHESSQNATPKALQQQCYISCQIGDKLDLLYSFIKDHLKTKIIVFLSTCKQVKFVFESFSKLKPGVTLLCLHGGMHQLKRMGVYDSFCSKQFVVLFATDIASRGLDFPAVDWVIQVDCAEDVKTYIHRVGRTGRKATFSKCGNALMMLQKHELAFIPLLIDAKVPITQSNIDIQKLKYRTESKFRSFNAEMIELHETAKRAFVSYCKFVHLTKSNKHIFNVDNIDLDAFAISLGLVTTPRLRFLKNKSGTPKEGSDSSKTMSASVSQSDSSIAKRNDHFVGAHNGDYMNEADCVKLVLDSVDNEIGSSDLFVKKRNKCNLYTTDTEEASEFLEPVGSQSKSNNEAKKQEKAKLKTVSLAKQAKALKNKKIHLHSHVKFDDEDDNDALNEQHSLLSDLNPNGGSESTNDVIVHEQTEETDKVDGIDVVALKERLKLHDKADKLNKQKLKREMKLKSATKDDNLDSSSSKKRKVVLKGFAEDEDDADNTGKDEDSVTRTKKKKLNEEPDELPPSSSKRNKNSGNKEHLFDYESLAQQESLILSLLNNP